MTRLARPSLARYLTGALLVTTALLWPAAGDAQQKPLRP